MKMHNVSFRHGPRTIVQDLNLSLKAGELLAVVGPNGSGKSTLLGLMSGRLQPAAGTVLLDDRPLSLWSSADLARRRAVLSQHSPLSFGFTVDEVVQLGRSAFHGRRNAQHERAQLRTAMQLAGASHLSGRLYPQLSGGEQKRVQLARAIAQILDDGEAPRYLLLDEPEASLDIAHQHAVLATARRLASQGIGVLAVLHELNLAARFADRVAVIGKGRLLRLGTPVDTLQPALLSSVYGIRMQRHTPPGASHALLSVA